jgi:hypothetical protein
VGYSDLLRSLKALGKGIGDVTSQIFLRELRGKWIEADPPLSFLALRAAQTLGYVPARIGNVPDNALDHLQRLGKKEGVAATDFPDFEAAPPLSVKTLKTSPLCSSGPHQRVLFQ